jgi:hypothetical protein
MTGNGGSSHDQKDGANDLRNRSPEALAAERRRRSIAIAAMLALMVVAFYATTLVRFGGAIANKGGAL